MNASGAALADRGWQRAFDDPIALPNGRELVTERGGPTMLARIAMMRALKAGKPGPEITPRRKRAKRYRVIQ
jgi:hypothetical protein